MTSGPHPDWLRPLWPAPAHVRALCTTRAGGASAPPFDTLNLGDHVGDDPRAVRANRAALGAALGGARPVFLRQVHGTAVAALHAALPDGMVADACVAATPGLACTIMVADCLPILLTDRQGRAVAAAHAGWRGLAGQGGVGVVESVFKGFSALALAGQAPEAMDSIAHAADTLAWLGPCIGPRAFEVGAEVRAAFCAHDAAAARHFTDQGGGKYLADLAGLARQRLAALGITSVHGNDGGPDWCTVSRPSRFFSHRRDSAALGGSGRMAACIWLG
ncbi:peptidoglycan editing factor PgeF [Simplicispira lacusdiani]|uniref:peptidoglycan editing factor PgeF n=1 Tax=Simplicispira lacusdiani TaxID=2213010 RepID=UPI000E721F9B|nr:peptidoglycan editing factor PgeF [Simplicispira lacusdiani]